jgi:hypothetical protein
LKRTLTILTIGLFTLSECQNTKKSDNDLTAQTQNINSDKDSIQGTSEQQLDSDTVTIQYKKSFTHEFSDNDTKDSFNVYLIGKTILWGRIKFEIKTASGQVIYSESFKASNIWDVTMNDSTVKAREKYVLSFIKDSFNEKGFFSPAIKPTDPFVEDYSNKEVWDELKADKTAIGFIFSTGYEDGRKIAYIKSLKRAVIYFECC